MPDDADVGGRTFERQVAGISFAIHDAERTLDLVEAEPLAEDIFEIQRQPARKRDDTHEPKNASGARFDFVKLAGTKSHLHLAIQRIEKILARPAGPTQVQQHCHVIAADPGIVVEALHRARHIRAVQCGHKIAAMPDRVVFIGNPAARANNFERFVRRNNTVADKSLVCALEHRLDRSDVTFADGKLGDTQGQGRQRARIDLRAGFVGGLVIAGQYKPVHLEDDCTVGREVIGHECRAHNVIAVELHEPIERAAIHANVLVLEVLTEQAQVRNGQVDRAYTLGDAASPLTAA